METEAFSCELWLGRELLKAPWLCCFWSLVCVYARQLLVLCMVLMAFPEHRNQLGPTHCEHKLSERFDLPHVRTAGTYTGFSFGRVGCTD